MPCIMPAPPLCAWMMLLVVVWVLFVFRVVLGGVGVGDDLSAGGGDGVFA